MLYRINRMAHVVRPLMQWPRWHLSCCGHTVFRHLFTSSSPLLSSRSRSYHQLLLFSSSFPFSFRKFRSRSGAVRFRDLQLPTDSAESDGESSDGNLKKSRNVKKREAKRAVRWGMELANFSPPQIKRILKVVSLEREVYDALMLVKRFGRDVREGKRRQFNYIGRLLREVDPELMDGLIQATKDGDQDKFLHLLGLETLVIEEEEEDDDDDEGTETVDDYGQESEYHIDVTTRWFNGLINRDVDIMNEVYSLQDVDFDRQELRRLVRKVHTGREHLASSEGKSEKLDKDVAGAERSLTRFLRGLAKQLTVEQN